VRRHRAAHRERRGAAPIPVVALVGYTNAGKSTLMNTLTQVGGLFMIRLFLNEGYGVIVCEIVCVHACVNLRVSSCVCVCVVLHVWLCVCVHAPAPRAPS
jgi:hypothetical protein